MTDPDVAAVLAEALQARFDELRWKDRRFAVEDILAALHAAGIACVYVPEGVAVAHGARLVHYSYYTPTGTPAYAIEDSP